MKTASTIATAIFLAVQGQTAPALTDLREHKPLYTYTIAQNGTATAYDETMAAATLQGVINRESAELYLLARTNTRPQFWLDLLGKDGHWLEGRERKPLPDLGALVKLAGK